MVWGDPDVGSLTPTGSLTNREVESKRPIKTKFCENILQKNDFVKTLNKKNEGYVVRNELRNTNK